VDTVEPQPPVPTPRSQRQLIEAALGQAAAMGGGAGIPPTPRPAGGSSSVPLVPHDTFPGYDVLREIHRGGQGVVYLAVQRATKRRVAVKVMHGGAFVGSAGRTRFEREVQVLGQLNHPNIVRIHDSGLTADGGFFYVMDYISGRPLDEHLQVERDAGTRVAKTRAEHAGDLGSKRSAKADARSKTKASSASIDGTLRLFAKICDGVNAAHLKGVIHRDLKPANIRIDAGGEPVIVDFGLAKIAAPDVTGGGPNEADTPQVMTMTGQFIGSLPWASPEQAQGSPNNIDLRTDVYSLGVILYQMLTGKFPYEVAGNMRDVLDNILRAEPAKPSTIRRQINDEVETIVLKCLNKDKERRYQSAGEVARDIEHYLRGEPIEAKRDSGWYVITKTLHRYKGVATIAAAFLVLILGFGAGMSFLYAGANSARRSAQVAEKDALAAKAQAVSERDRADANFSAVRALAHTFIFDFYDKIEKLRGATRAKEQLAREASTYLDQLRPQAPTDRALAAEIADAYDRLGDILGGLYMPKRGDTAGAAAAYAKARQIRQSLRDAQPDAPQARADLAKSFFKTAAILSQNRDYAGAQRECERSLSEYDAALRLAATAPAAVPEIQAAQAGTLKTIGDLFHNMAEDAPDPDTAARHIEAARSVYAQAESYWQKQLTADPSNVKAARMLPVLLNARAGGRSVVGNALAEAGLAGAKKQSPDARELFEDAAPHFDAARQMATQAAADLERLSAAHPESAEARRDLYLAYHNIGQALMLAGQTQSDMSDYLKPPPEPRPDPKPARRQALEWYEKALQITDALARADEANLEARRDLYICLNKTGVVLQKLGDTAAAAERFTRSLAIRDDVVLTDDTQQHHMDRALARYKLASMQEQFGDDAARPATDRRTSYQAAADLYTQSGTEFRALAAADVLRQDSSQIKTVDEKLQACRDKLAKLGP
jgi:serine/threonine protein kinase